MAFPIKQTKNKLQADPLIVVSPFPFSRVGTGFCNAPEVLDGDYQAEPAMVWSLGVLLYELTTSKRTGERFSNVRDARARLCAWEKSWSKYSLLQKGFFLMLLG